MTEIRIRHEAGARAVPIAEVYDLDDLDAVLDTIRRWGIEDASPNLIGAFVVNEAAAWFEIVVLEDES